ncbi:MAG TPA: CBS domain-containing protein [Streptosporangiaceae bacterium]
MVEAGGPGPHAPVTAADVMQPAATTVEPEDHVAAAAYLMRHAGTTALVIVDAQDPSHPVGLITEADVVRAVADGKDVNHVRIREMMTAGPTVIAATTRIPDAARLMMTGHFRHLPVVSDRGLVGIVDIRNVCQALLDATP